MKPHTSTTLIHVAMVVMVATAGSTPLWSAPPRSHADGPTRDGRAALGGPDTFGYAFADSTQAECSFSFVDIAGAGTALSFTDPDDGGAAVSLSAAFELYGSSYANAVVSTNGYLAFASGLDAEDGTDFSNDTVPAIPDTATATIARVLALHDDLEAGAAGTAWFDTFPACPRPPDTGGSETCTVIQWSDWSIRGGGVLGDIQILLYHDSREVVAQHNAIGSTGGSATVGIQGSSGDSGLAYAVNAAGSIPAGGHAVCFFHPSHPLQRTDLAVSLVDKTETVVPGGEVGYLLEVANPYGPSAVTSATVNAQFPTELSCSWACAGEAGAACSAAGTGDISDSVDLPLGASVAFEVSCSVAQSATGALDVQAEASRTGWTDLDPADNSAADTNAVLGLDLGTAPAPYPTSLVDNGARHGIDGALFLGMGSTADDGVTFVDPLDPGTTARIEVTASSIGRLDAWIDFNRDGDWSDADEQVAQNVVLDTGVNELLIPIPITATPGSTWTRFRLSRLGGLASTGVADHGEVEDHAITTVPVTLLSFEAE